jgi:predicted ABC-class ATPase
MKTKQELRQMIGRTDGRAYPALKDLKGIYAFGPYALSIDHVQGDPFAAPSDLSLILPGDFPPELWQDKASRIALQDHLLRKFSKTLNDFSRSRGSGKSGQLFAARPGQEILERTSCQINGQTGQIRMRFRAGLPAHGRRVDGNALETMLLESVDQAAKKALFYEKYSDKEKQEVHDVHALAQDQKALRQILKDNHWTAFVKDGAILPRKSGISGLPMEQAVPFESPESLRQTVHLPYAGAVSGMTIPEGITLICGGGYHGKSTLLDALEKGVYNHIRHDGREYVVTEESAMKIRAEDGRNVQSVNISPFISHLPNKKDTNCFSTEDASGSTSQAAALMEALESGSRTLLMDEDTSAANFMVRDALMQEVIHPDQEPITPLSDQIKNLDCSVVLAAGSSGAFFQPADLILQMDAYRCKDITQLAKEKAAAHPAAKSQREQIVYASRIPLPANRDRTKIKTHRTDTVSIGREETDLRLVEQLVDTEQTAAIGQLMVLADKYANGKRSLQDIASLLEQDMDNDFNCLHHAARPRKQELMAAFNRQRHQKIVQR